jgi:hypothetical protein
MLSNIIKTKSIKDIVLIMYEYELNNYKYSRDIAEFNYDENKIILKKICRTVLSDIDISNILYITSLIELLGSKYINFAIILDKNNFMIDSTQFSHDIGKYIYYQNHTSESYTIAIRKSAKIIEYKYNNPNNI